MNASLCIRVCLTSHACCNRDYYGLGSLPVDLLLVRSRTPKKRKVYIVSRAVKGLALNQKQQLKVCTGAVGILVIQFCMISPLKIVNLGVRVFQRSEGRDVNCPLRLVSEVSTVMLHTG